MPSDYCHLFSSLRCCLTHFALTNENCIALNLYANGLSSLSDRWGGRHTSQLYTHMTQLLFVQALLAPLKMYTLVHKFLLLCFSTCMSGLKKCLSSSSLWAVLPHMSKYCHLTHLVMSLRTCSTSESLRLDLQWFSMVLFYFPIWQNLLFIY